MSLAVMSVPLAMQSTGPAPPLKATRPVQKRPGQAPEVLPVVSEEEDAERWDGMS